MWERVCVGLFKPTQYYSSSSQCGGSKALQIDIALASSRNPNPCVSCLCHSPTRLQTPHSTTNCGGASCHGVWSKIRDEFNSVVSPSGCLWMVCESTCVFESDPRCSQSSLNKCGLIPVSPSFPNGLVHLKCLYDLSTYHKLIDLSLRLFWNVLK